MSVFTAFVWQIVSAGSRSQRGHCDAQCLEKKGKRPGEKIIVTSGETVIQLNRYLYAFAATVK
ncbi:hypothetical protein ACX3YG_27445 [Pseudomonas wadenswilerensis]